MTGVSCQRHIRWAYHHGWWWFGPFDGAPVVRWHSSAVPEALHDLIEPRLDVLSPVADQHCHQRLHLVLQLSPVVTLDCMKYNHTLCVCVYVCVCVGACVCVCVCVCVWVSEWMCVSEWVCVCVCDGGIIKVSMCIDGARIDRYIGSDWWPV